mmetsp:Transcript_90120/g.215262  ORF Transcript_90120/g.215262 Transcript_90120/m.215262 type:complete len:217 (+) Transcript_90120:823-1473(+)
MAFRSFSSFGSDLPMPVICRVRSSDSAPSPQSLRSSSKPCLKTCTRFRCCANASMSCLSARWLLSHCRLSASTAGAQLTEAARSTSPLSDSSRSFFSSNSLRRFKRSSSSAAAAFSRSSRKRCIWRSCSSLRRAFSSQLLLSMCSISLSCFWNFCSASRSAAEPPAPPAPVPISFFLSSSTSALSLETWDASSFLVADTLMAFARFAYRSVDIVSS